MNSAERQRFEMLSAGASVTADYLDEFYGLAWPPPEPLAAAYRRWLLLRTRKDATLDTNELPSRYDLELFMRQNDVAPKSWIAARMGMTTESLERLFERLPELGMSRERYVVYGILVADSLSDDVVSHLPTLRFRTFGTHDSYCERLHADLNKALHLEVERLDCATSKRLTDDSRRYAEHIDCLTLEPLSVKHQMWLDFGKPLSLAPDRCSKLFYAENRDQLRPYCTGSGEPRDLEEYERFLQGAGNG